MPNYFAKPSKAAATAPQKYSSIREKSHEEKIIAARKLQSSSRPIPVKNAKRKARRELNNQKYYASAEWKAKKKAVHERDGFQCVELVGAILQGGGIYPNVGVRIRCETRGEIVNGKQTARGLVCEETSYGHRGIPGRIDTCKTRCKDHDRALTPRERPNHRFGFSKVGGGRLPE